MLILPLFSNRVQIHLLFFSVLTTIKKKCLGSKFTRSRVARSGTQRLREVRRGEAKTLQSAGAARSFKNKREAAAPNRKFLPTLSLALKSFSTASDTRRDPQWPRRCSLICWSDFKSRQKTADIKQSLEGVMRGEGGGPKSMLISEESRWFRRLCSGYSSVVVGCAPGQLKSLHVRGKSKVPFAIVCQLCMPGASIKHGRRWRENYLLRQLCCAK